MSLDVIISTFIIICILVAGGILMLLRSRQKKDHYNKCEKEKKDFDAYYQKYEGRLKESILQIYSLYETCAYISHYQVKKWKDTCNDIYREGEKFLDQREFLKQQKGFKDWNYLMNQYKDVHKIREAHNDTFISRESQRLDTFFSSIEGYGLDREQRRACLAEEDNNLIVAGAGTGKTTTIVGKVRYLIEHKGVQPSEILLVSYSNKACDHLTERLGIDGLKANTFHSFCKSILSKSGKGSWGVCDDVTKKNTLNQILKSLLQNKNFHAHYTNFFLTSFQQQLPISEFNDRKQYNEYLRKNDFRKTLRARTSKKYTAAEEQVRSMEECLIANFLFLNGIDYEYEKTYPHKKNYSPDFTIKSGNIKIYLEHFGISRDQKVPKFFIKENETQEEADKRYTDGILWKREIHEKNETILIESYSYEHTEGTLFENLTKNLKKHQINLQPLSDGELQEVLEKSGNEKRWALEKIAGTFIGLMKGGHYTTAQLHEKIKRKDKSPTKTREKDYFQLLEPIYKEYQKYLQHEEKNDFSDMIRGATNALKAGSGSLGYKYIIVDEFQDTSFGLYYLLEAIKERDPKCKLFCVGDDWQSIYRFSGSDIKLFTRFHEYFGETKVSHISTTYRFSNPLISLSSEFICRNPNQLKKNIQSGSKNSSTKTTIVEYKNSEKYLQLEKILDTVMKRQRQNNYTCLILARRNKQIQDIRSNIPGIKAAPKSKNGHIIYTSNDSKLEAQLLTVHKAKGLEADIVIMTECFSALYGFPLEVIDDPILNLVMSEEESYEHSEERRLFYVALTRAKKEIILHTSKEDKSKFVEEIEELMSKSNLSETNSRQ